VNYLLQYAHKEKQKIKKEYAMSTRKNKKGQTMVEYIIIVALIAISLIAVFTYFGRATAKKVAGATEAISEQEGSKAQEAADNINEDTIKKLGEN
jgi:Flp pilus assembly pilin Flp